MAALLCSLFTSIVYSCRVGVPVKAGVVLSTVAKNIQGCLRHFTCTHVKETIMSLPEQFTCRQSASAGLLRATFPGINSDGKPDTIPLRKSSLEAIISSVSYIRNPTVFLEDCQEALEFLVRCGNDKEACRVIYFLESQMGTSRLFMWLNEKYWFWPLYCATDEEEKTNCISYFKQLNQLPETKKAVCFVAARVWFSSTVDQEVDMALDFLLCCFDSQRFAVRAPHIDAAFRKFREQNRYGGGGVEIGKDERDQILAVIRQATEGGAGQADRKRLEHTLKQERLPQEISRVLKHAYINAGGDVILS